MATVSIPHPANAARLAPSPILLFLDARNAKKRIVDMRKRKVVTLNRSELDIRYILQE